MCLIIKVLVMWVKFLFGCFHNPVWTCKVLSYWIRFNVACSFVQLSNQTWSEAIPSVSVHKLLWLLPTKVGTYHSLNWFGHIRYVLQTIMYKNIAKLITHPHNKNDYRSLLNTKGKLLYKQQKHFEKKNNFYSKHVYVLFLHDIFSLVKIFVTHLLCGRCSYLIGFIIVKRTLSYMLAIASKLINCV